MPDRLPTVSAAQALDDLKTDPQQFITTGLEALDQALANVSDLSLGDDEGSQLCRGIQRGQVVEVWGPPASGKTTLAYDLNLRAVHIVQCAHLSIACKWLPTRYEMVVELCG